VFVALWIALAAVLTAPSAVWTIPPAVLTAPPRALSRPPPVDEPLDDGDVFAAAEAEADTAAGDLDEVALLPAFADADAEDFALPELACLEAFAEDLAAVLWAFVFAAFGALLWYTVAKVVGASKAEVGRKYDPLS